MQLRLHPQQPDMAPIEVNETLFTIGRSEEAFAEFDRSLVARLSRRHAKLFEQDGAVYVADLNSRNGTLLNGQAVDAVPCRLSDGDELEVGKLVFRVELEEAALDTVMDDSMAEPEVTLVLETAHEEHDLTPIVVTRFPFLVKRDSEVFTPYLERAAKQVEYISAKHAHFYLQNGQVYVEDLSSTNGTLLNDVKVDEQPQVVRTGDHVAFGGDFFEYRVRVLRADDSIDRTVLQDIDRGQSSEGTIFVDSPTSFIDIFDTQDKSSSQPAPSLPSLEEFPDVSEEHKSMASPVPEAAAAAAAAAAAGRKKSRGGWKAAALLLLLIGGAGGGYYYFSLQPSAEKLERLLYQGDYAAGTTMAKKLLAGGGADAEAQRLALVVMLRANVPVWLQAYNDRDTLIMARVIDELRASSALLPELNEYAEMLEWAGETRSLLADRNARSSELARLRNWWIFNSAARQNTLQRLVGYVPGVRGLQEGIQAQVRALQSR